MSPKVLITDAVHPIMLQRFEEVGWHIDYQPDITPENVIKVIENFELLVINSKIMVDKAFIDHAKKLKVVGRLGSGKEIIDERYAREKNIVFHNSPEGNSDAVAEHAMGLLLGLLHHIPRSYQEVQNMMWQREKNRGTELKGKTVAIIGYGNTGYEMAKRLFAFGVHVLAYDKYKSNYSDEYAIESTAEKIYSEADIVSIHLPLTPETNQLINTAWINQFRKPIFLINTARGKIIRTADLIDAIESGKIGGAALDVLENEKINTMTKKESEELELLFKTQKVIVTPHIAGWTFESKFKLAEILSDKMILSWNFH